MFRLSHTDLPLEDAIELYKSTDTPVDLSGWHLSNNADDLRKVRLPAGTTVQARGFRVIYENQLNTPGTPGLTVPFSGHLGNNSESISLLRPEARRARVKNRLQPALPPPPQLDASPGGQRGALIIRGAGLLQEIIVAALVGSDFAGVDVQHPGREVTDEMHVVRDEDQRPLIALQGQR